DHDRGGGLERVERRASAAEIARLLADGCDRRDRAGPGLRHPPRDLERDVRAEPVVERARREPSAAEVEGLAGDDAHVARANELERLRAVARPDVEVQVLDRRSLGLLAAAERLPLLPRRDGRNGAAA